MTTASDLVAPESALKSHSPCPVPAGAFSIVVGVVLSVCANAATGPMPGGLPVAAVAVIGVSVSDPPVPAAPVEPLTGGALAAAVTPYPALLSVASVTLHAPTVVRTVWLCPVSFALNGVIDGAVIDIE